jgi:excisionase family DNA binding protein
MTRRNITRDFSRFVGVLIGVTIVTEVNIAIHDARSEPTRDRVSTGVSRLPTWRASKGAVKVSDQELPRWVTIKQAAEYYQLDPKTIRRMIARGKLKARRIGEKSIRVDRESLLESAA